MRRLNVVINDKIGEALRVLSSTRRHRTAAIIVAAGSGSRMRADITKQFILLDGIPVVIRSILAFEASEYIDEIIIVAKSGEAELYPPLLEEYSINKVTRIVTGGETRQESVWNGFCAISDKIDFVAIHDAARPLITTEQIKKVVLAGYDYRAATAGATSRDSVKLASISEHVDRSLDRDKVWLVQTPQVFYADLYRAAAVVARKDNFKGTDDCSLAEHAGFSVKLVDCGHENIKLTSHEDLLFALAIINERKTDSAKKAGTKE